MSVALSTDGNVAITGMKVFQLTFIRQMVFFVASSDGLLSAWSTVTGLNLATFHFNQNLVKLLVSQSGGRIARPNQSIDLLAVSLSSSSLRSHSPKYTLCGHVKSLQYSI